ncbi:type I-A CRISPR-associated protein Csa5 [Thermodesulfovibrio sp. TK110]
MILLYTPSTGFPDLEVKIAYGLARVGIESGINFEITPQAGFYIINFETNSLDKIHETLLMLLKRLLTSNRFYELGVKAKDKGKYTADEETIKKISKNLNFASIYSPRTIINLNFKKDTFCGHEELPKFGGRTGLILLSSFHAGKPYERDKRFSTFNQSLCSVCGYLAVLGLYSFGFIIQLGTGKNKKYVLVLPLPKKTLNKESFIRLLSLQKTLHNFWLSNILPLRTFTIGLLAKVPSLCEIVNELELSFYLMMLSKDNRGDTAVEQNSLVETFPFSRFIAQSSYNSATVEKLLGSVRKDDLPKITTLLELVELIENRSKDSLLKFPRLYVQETSPKNGSYVNLLYPETAKYLLKEVAMISQNIIENPSLSSLAKTLRYFIRERKYGYADDIRNAREDSRDFEETIAKMLREGRLRLEQKEMIHLPTDSEIQEVFRLANQDFEATKTALVILAFSFPSGTKEEVIETTEG